MPDQRSTARGRWIIAGLAGGLLLALAPVWLGAPGLLLILALVWRRGLRRGGLVLLYALTPGVLLLALRQGRGLPEGLIFAALSILVWISMLAGWESCRRPRRTGLEAPAGDWNPLADTGPPAQSLRIELPAMDGASLVRHGPRMEEGVWIWPDGWRLPAAEGERLEWGAGRWSIVAMADPKGLWVIDHAKDACWRLTGWQLAGAAADTPWLEPLGGGSLQRLSEVLAQQPPAAVEQSGGQRWPRGISLSGGDA